MPSSHSSARSKPRRGESSMKSSSNGTTSVAPTKAKVVVVRYRECRKNHAANIGGYAVDGCREFMASGEEGTTAALRCAACSCHRSFHKREVVQLVDPTVTVCDCSSNSNSSSYGPPRED